MLWARICHKSNNLPEFRLEANTCASVHKRHSVAGCRRWRRVQFLVTRRSNAKLRNPTEDRPIIPRISNGPTATRPQGTDCRVRLICSSRLTHKETMASVVMRHHSGASDSGAPHPIHSPLPRRMALRSLPNVQNSVSSSDYRNCTRARSHLPATSLSRKTVPAQPVDATLARSLLTGATPLPP
jgi:hypothetical protein